MCREPALQSGGGGLLGTLDDYVRLCSALTVGGTTDGPSVLARPTIELMRTNHLPGGGHLRDFVMPGGYGEVGFDGNGFGRQVAVGLGPAEDLFAVFMTRAGVADASPVEFRRMSARGPGEQCSE